MPEDFAGKPDAAISPFYKALSRTLGGPTSSPGAKAIKVKDMIKGRFARTKMGQMYALTTTQFDTVLIEVKAHVCWRPLIEEVGGGNFRVPQCPSSARLVEISSQAADTGRGAVTNEEDAEVELPALAECPQRPFSAQEARLRRVECGVDGIHDVDALEEMLWNPHL